MCRKIAGIGTLGLEKPSIQVQKTQFEEQFFVKQRISHCERLQTPIVCLGVLLRQKDQYMSIQNILPLPLMLKIPAWNTELGDLLRYVRRLRTYEMGYWCEGSREILRKSRYYRKHLVYDIPPLHTQRIIHPCPALAKRDLPLYSLEASEQNTERTSAVFGVFHELTKKKRFPSKRWLKFARAVKKSVAEENHLSNKWRRSRIRECINTFDPPKRRHNVAGRETIQAMYSKTQQMGRAETPSRETEEQEEEGSQSFESFLRAIVYSAEDSEAIRADDGPLSTLLELGAQHTKEHERNAKGLSPNFINRKSHNSVAREGGRLSPLGELQEGAERRHDVGTRQESGKLFLEAPENLVCASSSLQLAAHFLRCNVRGVVYLPPQLSFLSALAVIINSFLSEPMCDHRVAVVCEPNAGMGETVNSYLDFTFDGKVSIDVARRADFATHPPLASLTKKTARVVILDSFEFTVSPGFALLVVFAPEVSSTLFEGPQSLSRSGTKVLSAASIWKSIPSVLVLPSYFHDTVISYSQKVPRFANLLDLKDTYFILEKDDIEHLLLLSRRSFLFLVPPRDVLEFIALLETEASSFFPAYQKIAAAEQCNTGGCISCLQDVDITVLEKHLREEVSHQRTETSGYTLEILYSLRQARSYALYDGYNAAVAYLNHYSQAASSKTLAALQSILADVPAPGQSSDKNSSETHPVATALENSFLSMEGEMENQAASLRSIHRRSKFRVLVITNSKESYDGLIKSLKNSRYILKAADGEIGLCELRHLWNGVENKRGGYRNEECEASTKFSHVYHVVNDRKGRSRDHFLPPLLMQYIHAGRTKLITVAVDETRTLESIHDRDVTLYRELSAAVQNIETREACRTLSYVTTISLLDVLASVNRLASPFEKINGMRPAEAVSLRDSTEGAGTNVILAPHRDLTRQERIRQQSFIETDVHTSAAEICMSSIPNIRQLLKAKLNSARCETNNGILTVVVKVAVGERCTPGTTFILAAIASDPDLLKHTKVTTILET
ncbi:unnamed protein product [Chondrus crispus]|uniref:Uncharacterized protein n=1 Tax=Chondrus crispus TaxID=2769 RepID=R7QGP8_CHOCR|nr:unnamed protein product [Chondrus crispus]CDF36636.1 unnamed protein product [Chondrus crispus]|eukprot:XP_005716455.1 unnamed protein product [Chondrus crispus]